MGLKTVDSVERATTDLPGDLAITVCAECLEATCWQGTFMCQESRNANIIALPVKRLLVATREHPSYWENDPNAVSYRQTGKYEVANA